MKADHALPALEWLRGYDRENLINDGLAAIIVTIMLIPQSLAYALLAGLPAEMGLYASILPLIAYALFGSSRTLSVGPVAVISDATATGPTERVRLLPKSAYAISGRIDAYKPISAGIPANKA